ncbi:MAG: C4-type zinc ribbon domain-containing protein [Alistipes sp.]|nr:C4-type zinc ribbon domain-containing protein [Alistipes sp.]
MATPNSKAPEAPDYSIEEKIIALYELQKIDSKIDEINKLKGELPLEVQDLEDEVAGLQTRIENINAEVDELTQLTKQRKEEIEQSKALITKYKEQSKNVRNNREFDSLNKEIEYQNLEIELSEKRLREYAAEIKAKKKLAEDAEEVMNDRKIDLEAKRAELGSIEEETAKEVEVLRGQEEKAQARIDERLLGAYKRIRGNVRNGLGVVTVKRDACGGCFNSIPPQRQFEIRQSKKIIVCEYCGRILVSDQLDHEDE